MESCDRDAPFARPRRGAEPSQRALFPPPARRAHPCRPHPMSQRESFTSLLHGGRPIMISEEKGPSDSIQIASSLREARNDMQPGIEDRLELVQSRVSFFAELRP